MPSVKSVAARAAVAAVFLSATPASAASTIIRLAAFVPVYCNVEFLPAITPAADGLINLGTSRELCNAPHGYRIILDHPANLEGAAIISDANRIPLSQSGETVLWNSDQPGLEVRQLALDVGKDPASINRLGLRIEVKY